MPSTVTTASRFDDALESALRALAAEDIALTCDGAADHRVVIVDDGHLRVCDHDVETEAVLVAVGGRAPTCIRVRDALAGAGTPELWASITLPTTSVDDDALRVLPRDGLRVLLARSLRDEFARASAVVQDSVAQLGLSLLAPTFRPTAAIATKFQMTREFPTWDTGARRWSDKELVLLSRYFRAVDGERRPHLQILPADPVARRTVATYAVGLLEGRPFLSHVDLRAALSPTFRNVRALTALLVSEGALTPSGGLYRMSTSFR